MAQFNITITEELLHGLFLSNGRDEAFSKLLEEIFNQILLAQSTEQIGVEPYERTEERTAYRNGFRDRQMTTRVGTLTLRVREIIGFQLANSESESSWGEFFSSFKDRELKDVRLVTSDDHKGLVNAVRKYFQGASWQRCQTHFSRNILDHTPKALQTE